MTGREKWLKERLEGIGASEASAVIGKSPYMSNLDLWNIKTGRVIPEDIGDKPYVQYGIKSEKYLREMFALDYPQYEVSYKDFDVIKNKKYPFIFATLDGRLVEKSTERKGILEIKTAESPEKAKWNKRVPDNYYIQVVHQLLSTGWDFAVLKAQLKYDFDGEIFLQTKHYQIERSEAEADIKFLQDREFVFWHNNVLKDIRPNLILPCI